MIKRMPIVMTILMLVAAGGALYLMVRPSDQDARLARLKESVDGDARRFRERAHTRPVLVGQAEPGCAVDLFRAGLEEIADADVAEVPYLEEFIALPAGQDDKDIVKKLRWLAAKMVERYPRLLDGLMRAARQSTGSKPALSIDDLQSKTFLSMSARFAVLLLLSDARLKAEAGKFSEGLDRCTAALVLSQDLSRGAMFHDVAASIMLHHLSLKGLVFLIDIGKPTEPELKEARRRVDVLAAHMPKIYEAFENDVLRRRLIRLSQAESRDEKNILAVRGLAIEALEEFERLLRRYRSLTGGTYRERRDVLRELDQAWRRSSNPLVRGFEFELDAFEQQHLGLVAEQRMLIVLCDREIDRLKDPSGAPEIIPLQDPFDGQPLRAYTQGGLFRVYSVGPDLIDQQGTSGDLILEIRR